MQILCRLLTFSLLFQFWLELSLGKRHNLTFTDDPRRNILLSEFGYGTNATLDFVITDFMIPGDVLKRAEARSYDKLGSIGFTLSRDRRIANEISTNPHICQLEQKDQGIDALFFIFDFAANMLLVIRSGKIQNMKLCTESGVDCPYSDDGEKRNATSPAEGTKIGGFFQNLFGSSNKKTPYLDFIPLEKTTNDHYNALFGIRFNSAQAGFYHLYFHNCFNYREHGYSDRVAVDFTVNIVERNVHSFLSVGDIPKPSTYVYTAFLFALATILWANFLCKSESKHIFRVHRLMLVLVFLKTLSLFFHGINYYFVSIYGHQRELWAIIFYVTHLLKGALLFGTIILIGTGYTFFKNFLTDRDRRLFIFVLPLQILDNVAMVILEESDIGDQRYFFWLEIFVFLDLVCCMAIIWPIVWSIRHLESGARVDGKIAFNLEKLRLFRQFYVIVVAYIYLTRGSKFIIEFFFSQETRWVSVLVVELANLFFFCLVGAKFRPLKGNPYLRLTQQDGHCVESGFALTSNGLFEKITRVRQVSEDGGGLLNDEMNMNNRGEQTDEEEGGDDDDTLLPKTGRDMGLLTL